MSFVPAHFTFFIKDLLFRNWCHELKYKNNKEVGEVMGRLAAIELSEFPSDFLSVDFIIPIPLHPKKLALRGYNQSECIANVFRAFWINPSIRNLLFALWKIQPKRVNRFTRDTKIPLEYPGQQGCIPDNLHLLFSGRCAYKWSTLEAAVAALSEIPGFA